MAESAISERSLPVGISKTLFLLVFLLLYGNGFCVASDWIFVQNISIIGNQKTRPQVILREMTFGEGDSLEVRMLDEIILKNQQNIFNLELFNSVELKPEIIDDKLYVVVSLKERWYIFPVPWGSIQERNSYDLLRNRNLKRLALGAKLKWDNISGRNDQLLFFGHLGFSQKLSVTFTRPAILPKQNVNLRAQIEYLREPEIIYGTDSARVLWGTIESEPLRTSYVGKLGIRKRFSARKSLYSEFQYKHFQFADSIYIFSPNFITTDIGREYYPSLIVSFVNDQRDYRSFPLDGFKYHVFARQAGFAGWGTARFSKVGITWAHHIPIGKRWNFAYGIHNVLALGDKIPYYEKNFIGVDTKEFQGVDDNLRGYQSYVINGTFINMTKVEGKYALLPLQKFSWKKFPIRQFREFPFGIYLSAFCDGGYIRDDSDSNQDSWLRDEVLIGYGFGLNIIGLYDNLLRIEYAWNHLNEGGIYLHASVSIK